MTRVALLVNIPAPYRVPVYDRLASQVDLRVIYMAEREAERAWQVPPLAHDHIYLRGREVRGVQLRAGVLAELRRFQPDVVMTAGFHPAMLSAWAYARAKGRAHVAVSDAWLGSETQLSAAHRFLRRRVFRSSAAFVGASVKSIEMFRHHGGTAPAMLAPLSIDNGAFEVAAPRTYDLVYAGRIIPAKLPGFFAETVGRIARHRSVSVLVIGDGTERARLERELTVANVRATFTGFVEQAALPALYAQGKILCFPTERDAWGLVANEACAAGLPVVTCPQAGCAGELVVDGDNGSVLPLDAERWALQIEALLADTARLTRASTRARLRVADYTFERAAAAFADACS